jgi:glutaredoxin
MEAPALGTLVEEETQTSHDDGDHERFAHYVRKDKIVESAVTGAPVIALCGKVWVPNRDPQKFPVCPDCKKIYEKLQGD